ncbi:MAG: phosphotransferase [Paludibacteraceae bacterium]|nr:phosphotransferase [Paludibacteraceae bacterium]
MEKNLLQLYKAYFGEVPTSIARLSAAGSNRSYYRLTHADKTSIGVIGTSLEENEAFIYTATHFSLMNLSVPRLLAVSDDKMCYLQEDLGDELLFDYIKQGRMTGIFSEYERCMLETTIRQLAHVQIKGNEKYDYSYSYPIASFDERSIMWDLNYFKYDFLKATGVDFQEDRLEDDFEHLKQLLLSNEHPMAFMYRDFQSRNVMIKDGKPYFIDFQGGRRGPLQYDVVSFLWQAKANIPNSLRNELLEAYLDELSQLYPIQKETFKESIPLFVLFRTLQVLGAYGFRGYFEHKAHFLQSIPYAMKNLEALLPQVQLLFPHLYKVIKDLLAKEWESVAPHDTLQVRVCSFSYKKGIPTDLSGNGGGFVFDCRAIHNPGRYAEYKPLTGMDSAVIDFLEENAEITSFLEHVYALVDASVERYLKRGFTDLMISFGCTGGQHRSVYAAQHTAEHIHRKYGVEVHLIHREQHIKQILAK